MRKGFLLFAAMVFTHYLHAQENAFLFSHLKESDGLSDNIINCFLKDSRGILWIGTYNGFNRYDGSNFFAYKKRKGMNSMGNEVVHSLCEDKKGNIWGGTDNGVFRFEPLNDRFVNYTIRSFSGGKLFYKILCDSQGAIWTASDCSLFKFNEAANKFDEVVKLTTSRDSAGYFQIRKNGILPDPSGKGLWLATRSGINYYDIEKNAVTNFQSQPGDSLFAPRSVSALHYSLTGKIWFCDNGQKALISFDPANRKIIQKVNIGEALPKAEGGTLFEDRNNRLWFASWTYQVLVVELRNGNRMYTLNHRPTDNRTISSPFFWAAFQDDDGTIWLGTASGIARCNPEKNVYRQFNLPDKIPELQGTSIHMAEEDPFDKSFWIHTQSSLLINYFPGNDQYEVYDLNKAKPGPNGELPGVGNSILFSNGHVIITTYRGAWQIKRGNKIAVPYHFLPAAYRDFKCAEMVFDGDSGIYYNDGKRVLYWNYRADKTKLITYQEADSVPTDRSTISRIQLAFGGMLWMMSTHGYIAFKNAESKITRVKIVNDEVKEAGTFVSLDTDVKGNLWVLNKGVGIYRYEPTSKAINFWDETNGLPSNRVHKTKPDNAGRIWSMFYNKISVFIPGPDRFYTFKLPFGEANRNYYNYLSRRSNGNMFGTIGNELVEFFPDRIEAVPAKIKPQISQLIVNGKSQQIIKDDRVLLHPTENTIRFRFGVLTDKNVFPYDIEYMLEGAEEGWTMAAGNNEALYNNLHPGTYRFKVRAKGQNTAWQTEETVLEITIKTPFYKTTWFLLAVGLLILASIVFLYRNRLAQKERLLLLESKAQKLEKEKVMVMYENLKQQLNPHFLFNSLTSLSGLIELDQKMAGNFLEQMSDIYRYILKNGDNETVTVKDEIGFVKVYINLQQTRFRKGLVVNIDVPENYLHYKIAPVTLQNLIENAIKHNIIDPGLPLVIDIFIEGDYLVVRNNLQRKRMVETSNKKGLVQFISLYRYLSRMPVLIEEDDKYFQIKVPLI